MNRPNISRDGTTVWPTCPECGCRLEPHVQEEFTHLNHFGMDPHKDARGCVCPLIDNSFWIETSLVEHLWG